MSRMVHGTLGRQPRGDQGVHGANATAPPAGAGATTAGPHDGSGAAAPDAMRA